MDDVNAWCQCYTRVWNPSVLSLNYICPQPSLTRSETKRNETKTSSWPWPINEYFARFARMGIVHGFSFLGVFFGFGIRRVFFVRRWGWGIGDVGLVDVGLVDVSGGGRWSKRGRGWNFSSVWFGLVYFSLEGLILSVCDELSWVEFIWYVCLLVGRLESRISNLNV